jgi:hypothetical protein
MFLSAFLQHGGFLISLLAKKSQNPLSAICRLGRVASVCTSPCEIGRGEQFNAIYVGVAVDPLACPNSLCVEWRKKAYLERYLKLWVIKKEKNGKNENSKSKALQQERDALSSFAH